MFPVVFILLWQSSIADVTGSSPNQITLKYESILKDGRTTLKCKNGTFYFYEMKQTILFIEKANTISRHKCFYNNGSKLWDVVNFKKVEGGSTALVKEFAEKIQCSFYMNRDVEGVGPTVMLDDNMTYTALNCEISIYLKPWKQMKLKINNEEVNHTLVPHSDEVDSKYVYEFVDKELVSVKCMKPLDIYGKFYFVFPGNINYTSDVTAKDEDSFQAILGAKHNFTHVDCIFKTNIYNLTLRVYFFLKTVEAIRVDGLAIRGSNDILQYYYYGDWPTVSCPDNRIAKIVQVQNKGYKGKAVCPHTEHGNKTVHLFEKNPENGIYLPYLLNKNVVFTTSYLNKCNIFYEYEVGDVIQFNATYGIDHSKVNCSIHGISGDIERLHMDKYNHKTKVTCRNKNNTTTVTFILSVRKKNVITTTKPREYLSEFTTTESDIKLHDRKKMSFLEEYGLILSIGSLFIILLLVIAAFVVVLWKRKKSTTEAVQPGVDYVNLPHNNDEQFPKRLNTDVYLKPQESSDYSVPIDNRNDVDLYSVPYKQKLEDLYAKPIPKNQRGNRHKDDVKYAAVEFKKPGNVYSNVKKPGNVYSNVKKPGNVYSNVKKPGNVYSNVNKKANAECIYAKVQYARPEDLYTQVKPEGERDTRSTCLNTSQYAEPYSY